MPLHFSESMLDFELESPAHPTIQAVNYVTQAWQALEALEADLPEEDEI